MWRVAEQIRIKRIKRVASVLRHTHIHGRAYPKAERFVEVIKLWFSRVRLFVPIVFQVTTVKEKEKSLKFFPPKNLYPKKVNFNLKT